MVPANLVKTFHALEEYVPGVSGQSRYLTSSLGIRGPEFNGNNNEYRILAIGGRTTENAYLDQDETWTLLLGEMLGRTGFPRGRVPPLLSPGDEGTLKHPRRPSSPAYYSPERTLHTR